MRSSLPAEGSVHLKARVSSDKLIVTVSDTGPGIPDELKALIFKTFVKGKEHTPGIGLGLALSHQLAAAMGGTLELEPRDREKGSVFTVSIPTIVSQSLQGLPKVKLPSHDLNVNSVAGLKFSWRMTPKIFACYTLL